MATEEEVANVELNDHLRVRVNSEKLAAFQKKSLKITGAPYQFLVREMITAFNEGRLRIIPTEDQKQNLESLGELYS